MTHMYRVLVINPKKETSKAKRSGIETDRKISKIVADDWRINYIKDSAVQYGKDGVSGLPKSINSPDDAFHSLTNLGRIDKAIDRASDSSSFSQKWPHIQE